MRNIYWLGLIILFVFLPLFSYINNSTNNNIEKFGGHGGGGGRGYGGHGGGGGRGYGHGGGGRGYGHGGRRYYGGYGGGGGSGYGYYNYYPSWYYYPSLWYNNWFGASCKTGCTRIKDGMWGCTNPGNNPDDCYFASDCYYCGN